MKTQIFRFIFLTVFFSFSILETISAQEIPSFTTAPHRELRAVWVTTLSGLDWPRAKATSAAGREAQKREFCALLDQLKAANINTVLLQTRVRGSVIYPSDIEPWDMALTGEYGRDPGYDPLAFAIEETHRRGMELHAWVVTIPCFKIAVAKQMGSRSVLKTHPELCKRHGEMYYLDPGLPGTADYLTRICHEIVSRYDIDGLHFDYIRYPENAASFSDAATYKSYGGGKDKALWRRDNITRIVRQIHGDAKALKPWVRISSSPVGKYADLSRFSARGWNARDAVYQDAEGWLREGIHDILFPMMYFDGNHFFPFAADWQEQSAGRQVAPGLGIYFMHPSEKNWPLSVIQRQLHFLRQQQLAGQCYFRSKFLTDNTKGLYTYLRETFYAYPALPPACTWMDGEAPQTPSHLQLQPINSHQAELTWTAPMSTPGGLRYNVYASAEWPVDVTRAENLVATGLTSPRYLLNTDYAAAHQLHLAVTAMDRAGRESTPLQAQSQDATDCIAQHFLPCDGHILRLPPTKALYITITDLAGRTLRRVKTATEIIVTRMAPGSYRAYAVTRDKRGNLHTRRIGAFEVKR